MTLPLRIVLILLALSPLFLGAADKKSVLAGIAQAYGGAERLLKVSHLLQKGEGSSVMKQAKGEILRVYSYPMKLRMEKRFSDTDSEIRVLNRSKGWRDGNAVTGVLLESMQLQAARLLLPRLLLDNPDMISYRGTYESEDGKSWHLLVYHLAPGAELNIQVGRDDYRIKATIGTLTKGEGAMQFITTYDDFKSFNGILFATTETHYAMNRFVGQTRLKEIFIVKQHADTAFYP